MKTKTYNVYTFSELSKEAQQKALENLYDINTDYSWYQYTIEEEQKALEKHGFDGVEILFSGFASQGDGACFTGSLDNDGLLKFLTETKQLKKYPRLVRALKSEKMYVHIKITHTDRYYHENSTTIDDYTEMQDNSDLPEPLQKEYRAWFDSFDGRGPCNESIGGWYYDTCRAIYRRLEKEYDDLTSEEAIIETIEANEYEFTENGKLD